MNIQNTQVELQTTCAKSALILVPNTIQSRSKAQGLSDLIGSSVVNCKILTVNDPRAMITVDFNEYSALIFSDWASDANGVNSLMEVRERYLHLPILVVGCNDSETVRVAAFEAGADNFVDSNFNSREVIAKLGRLLERRDSRRPSIEVWDLQVWPDSQIAFRSGVPVKLSATELAILNCLAVYAPAPVDRRTLLTDVFGLDFDPGTNIVEVHVHRLRQKIDAGQQERLVNTVRGRGYTLGRSESASGSAKERTARKGTN